MDVKINVYRTSEGERHHLALELKQLSGDMAHEVIKSSVGAFATMGTETTALPTFQGFIPKVRSEEKVVADTDGDACGEIPFTPLPEALKECEDISSIPDVTVSETEHGISVEMEAVPSPVEAEPEMASVSAEVEVAPAVEVDLEAEKKMTAQVLANGIKEVMKRNREAKPAMTAAPATAPAPKPKERKKQAQKKAYKRLNGKVLPDNEVTEKMIKTTPIHGLRNIVSRTAWMLIPKYSKMGADQLRKEMLKALEEHRAIEQ